MERKIVNLVLCLALLHVAVSVFKYEAEDAVTACRRLLPRRSPNIAGFVRVAFHDCVGGCDGCIDLGHEDNKGLKVYLDALNSEYSALEKTMSRADFWAICAATAVQLGYENSLRGPENSMNTTAPPVVVKYGRKDASDCEKNPPKRSFPNSLGDLNHVMTFFKTNFNFTYRQTVALMGAHTLGRARVENSGFDSRWVNTEYHLNNRYYTELLSAWHQVQKDVNGIKTKWQWVRPNGINLMLNSDMCLAYDIKPDTNGKVGNLEQASRHLSASASRGAVEAYAGAANNNKWLQQFGKVFTLMISKTADQSKLQVVQPNPAGYSTVAPNRPFRPNRPSRPRTSTRPPQNQEDKK